MAIRNAPAESAMARFGPGLLSCAILASPSSKACLSHDVARFCLVLPWSPTRGALSLPLASSSSSSLRAHLGQKGPHHSGCPSHFTRRVDWPMNMRRPQRKHSRRHVFRFRSGFTTTSSIITSFVVDQQLRHAPRGTLQRTYCLSLLTPLVPVRRPDPHRPSRVLGIRD